MTDRTPSSGAMEASEAARIMQDPHATEAQKSVAASVLSQADGRDAHTSERVASEAADELRDGPTAEDRSVAGSDLSQARRDT